MRIAAASLLRYSFLLLLALLPFGRAAAASSDAGALVDSPVFDSPIYVAKAGDPSAPPVVLVHGLGADASRSWHAAIDALDEHYYVLVLDLPGFGRSPAPEQGALSPERYARVIDWLIEREGLADVRLVGHSMGGAIALQYAGSHPTRLHSVTLVGAAGFLHPSAYVKALTQRSLALPELPEALEHPARWLMAGVHELMGDFAGLPSLSAFLRSDGMFVGLLGRPATVTAALALMEADFSAALDRVAVPVALIWGGEDAIAPMRTAHLLAARLPGSRMHLLPNSGHMPMIDEPIAFEAALTSALEYRGSAGRGGRARTGGVREHHCDGAADQTISGTYERIVIRDCIDATLTDVRARRIEIRDSIVRMINVRVTAADTVAGIAIDGSHVTATGLEVSGEPAVSVADSQLDAAGSAFRSPGTAIAVTDESAFVFSVSKMRGGVYTGYLHGAADVADASLGTVEAVRSSMSPPAQRAAAPGFRPDAPALAYRTGEGPASQPRRPLDPLAR